MYFFFQIYIPQHIQRSKEGGGHVDYVFCLGVCGNVVGPAWLTMGGGRVQGCGGHEAHLVPA